MGFLNEIFYSSVRDGKPFVFLRGLPRRKLKYLRG